MPPKRTIESFFKAASKRRCQHIENETEVNEGEVWGEVINVYRPPTFSFAPPALQKDKLSSKNRPTRRTNFRQLSGLRVCSSRFHIRRFVRLLV